MLQLSIEAMLTVAFVSLCAALVNAFVFESWTAARTGAMIGGGILLLAFAIAFAVAIFAK